MKHMSKKEREKKITDECKVCVRTDNQNCNNADFIVKDNQEIIKKTIINVYHHKNVKYSSMDIEDCFMVIIGKIFEKNEKQNIPCCYRIRAYKPGKRGLYGWIKMIACRLASNHLRGKYLNEKTKIDYDIPIEETFFLKIDFPCQDEEIDKKELLSTIKNIIDSFPNENEKLILKLHFYDGLSTKEIAKFLQKSVTSIYTRKSRAIRKLKSLVEEHYR